MATAPRPGRAQARGEDELTVKLGVGGNKFVLYPNLVTAKDARAIRAQVGMSLQKLIATAQEDPDIDVIAALVWVARCQAGDDVTLDEVGESITYESDLDLDQGDEPMEPDHPLL